MVGIRMVLCRGGIVSMMTDETDIIFRLYGP